VSESVVDRARSLVLFGALVVAGGVAVAGTVSQTAGGVLVVGGWLLLVWAIHRFGRARDPAPKLKE
jgi:hypothetical protein